MNKEYYENRDEILARRAEYYQNNKEMIKERNKIYYKEYYEKNKPKMIARANEWLIKIKNTDYERYRNMLNECQRKCYDKKRKKNKSCTETKRNYKNHRGTTNIKFIN